MTKEQYALNHPAGRIGKRLIFKVQDVTKKEHEVPICKENDLLMEQPIGVDKQRVWLFDCAYGEKIFHLTIGKVCNRSPRSIGPHAMAVDAMEKMEGPPSPLTFLPVVNCEAMVIGIVTLHALLSTVYNSDTHDSSLTISRWHGYLPTLLSTDSTFGVSELEFLFSEQQKYLHFFFTYLDYVQDHAFTLLCFQARGSIFFVEVGKSNFIAQKISQTLVSTGTKAASLNPTDALHGDIGIVAPPDVVVLL
ncbi:hypothetical protein L7F22_036294 [Adiantum nelumboides]|nr:hypothetical protein [Adiantum nelumboides]